jgi:hypothetical protein
MLHKSKVYDNSKIFVLESLQYFYILIESYVLQLDARGPSRFENYFVINSNLFSPTVMIYCRVANTFFPVEVQVVFAR